MKKKGKGVRYRKSKKDLEFEAWKRQCSGKTAHETRGSAEYILEMRRDYDQVIYKCQFCKKFHTGHTLEPNKNIKK